MRTSAGRSLALVLLVLGSFPALSASEDTSREVSLGRRIYTEGSGADGREILAQLGAGGVEVPASVLPCTSCHGADGKGKPEGGVFPSDLTWSNLTKPYTVALQSGRYRPPYDERLLKRAFAMGIDSGGSELHVAMPRYRLLQEEATALVGYLKTLGHQPVPGLDDATIRIGVMLPTTSQGRSQGERTRALLEARVQRLNGNGGIFSRNVALEFVLVPEDAESRRQAVERFLDERPVLALVSGFMAGAEAEIASLMEERQVPLVGPGTLNPELSRPVNPYVFYLVSGVEQQARALVDFAARQKKESAAVVIHPQHPLLTEVAMAIRSQGAKHGRTSGLDRIGVRSFPTGRFDAAALVDSPRLLEAGVVFFLGSDDEGLHLLAAAHERGWSPDVFFLGALAGRIASREHPPFEGRIFLSLPNLPARRATRAYAAYLQLADDFGLAPSPSLADLATWTAADVLFEALERAGRSLSRARLVQSLESLQDFESGLGPPISYGPNRRVGASGAYVVAFEPGRQNLRAASEWITPR